MTPPIEIYFPTRGATDMLVFEDLAMLVSEDFSHCESWFIFSCYSG
jgi:hypothetical protein